MFWGASWRRLGASWGVLGRLVGVLGRDLEARLFFAEWENMQRRGSSDSRATADSHCDTQGSRNEVKCHGNASAEMNFNLGK